MDLHHGNDSFLFIDKSNIAVYCDGLGIVGTEVIPSGIPLPEGIKFTDNIIIFKSTGSSIDYLLYYTSNNDNYYYNYNMGETLYCKTSSGTNIPFDCYVYDSTNKIFSFSSTATSFKRTWYGNVLFSYKDFYVTSPQEYWACGCGDFFKFYYTYKNFPYITNTAENLAEGSSDVLVLPRRF